MNFDYIIRYKLIWYFISFVGFMIMYLSFQEEIFYLMWLNILVDPY